MNNFEYSNPTRLVFGKGEESRIGELMRARVPAMSPVLVVYGGGSAKESGLLERISESLKAADLVPIELGGVTPNPQLSFVQKGILLAREHRVKAILAVGGGSVIDASKAIAIGVPYVVMFGISSQRKLPLTHSRRYELKSKSDYGRCKKNPLWHFQLRGSSGTKPVLRR